MHGIIFAISTIPGSSRQIILDILQASLELETGENANIDVISHQNIYENIFLKSFKVSSKIKKWEVREKPPGRIKKLFERKLSSLKKRHIVSICTSKHTAWIRPGTLLKFRNPLSALLRATEYHCVCCRTDTHWELLLQPSLCYSNKQMYIWDRACLENFCFVSKYLIDYGNEKNWSHIFPLSHADCKEWVTGGQE